MEVLIQKAAMDLGILPSVIIRRIEEGELTGRKQGSIWYVELPENERELAPLKSQLARMGQRELAEQDAPSSELIDSLHKQVKSQAKQIKIKDSQIQDLHYLLHQSLQK